MIKSNTIVKTKKDVVQRSLTFKDNSEEIKFLTYIVNEEYVNAIKTSLDVRSILPANLADEIGVSRSYVSQIFNGTRMVNMAFITKIRRRYGIPLELIDTSRYYSNVTFVVFHWNASATHSETESGNEVEDVPYVPVTQVAPETNNFKLVLKKMQIK
ncbi:MAG: helix-turn-helix transcriptional regulator [Bacteroidota bacterium]|nr:helix-turn-helix transcriptional regulator [Bacteroidota bacterium]